MKTLAPLCLLIAFVFCVANAALTSGTMPIIAAAIVAALLIGLADESAPIYRYVPGQRHSSTVDVEIAHVSRQIQLWQAYLLLSAMTMLFTGTHLALLLKDGRWPGGWIKTLPGLEEQREGILLGLIVASLMIYCLVISVGCIQPLQTVLTRLHNEWNVCSQAERNRAAVIGNPDWRADNQLDWDRSPVARDARRRNQEDGITRPPFTGSY